MAQASRAAALLAATALAFAGCSSSATHGPSASGAPSNVPQAVPTGSGTPADPATVRAVKQAYGDFFSSTTTIARSQAVLQHGNAFHAVLVKEANSPQSDNVKIVVTAVRLLSPDTALVTYTLHAAGVALPDSRGYARPRRRHVEGRRADILRFAGHSGRRAGGVQGQLDHGFATLTP